MSQPYYGIADSLSRPVKNTNFKLIGNEIYFHIGSAHTSRNPVIAFNDEEIQLYNKIDGERHFIEFEFFAEFKKISPIESLLLWYELGIVEFLPQPVKNPLLRNIVVIEAHMDDAVLSVSGSMLSKINNSKFSIVTMVGPSDYTSYSYYKSFEPSVVSGIRRSESLLASKLLHSDYYCLEELDQPIRWKNKDEHDLSTDTELDRISEKLFNLLGEIKPDEIWFPLALGFHADHYRARDMVLRMLVKHSQFFSETKILAYEDQPYLLNYPEKLKNKIISALNNDSDAILIRNDISEEFNTKVNLTSLFGSQFKIEKMKPYLIEAAKKIPEEDKLYEDLWQLTDQLQEIHINLWQTRAEIEYVSRLLSEHQVINILKFDFFVQYDVESLLALFPHLNINLYLPIREIKRSADFASDRVVIQYVDIEFEAMIHLSRVLIAQCDTPLLIFNPELVFDAKQEQLINQLSKPVYTWFWFSSFILDIIRVKESNSAIRAL